MSTDSTDSGGSTKGTADSETSLPVHDPFAAIRIPHFRWLITGNVLSMLGIQALAMALGWEIFQRTNDPLFLGLIGLVQVIPFVAMVLPAGTLVDRYNRKKVVMLTSLAVMACIVSLALVSGQEGPLWVYYLILFVFACSRSIGQPARAALLPEIVPQAVFGNAVAWSSGGFQLTMVIGPALGGWVIHSTGGATAVYWLAVVGCCIQFATLLFVPSGKTPNSQDPVTLQTLLAGMRFVWRSPVILAAISLDMFAVLFGGATALLPVYAETILKETSLELGLLRSAPGVGAIMMAAILLLFPPIPRAGRALLWSVAVFGLATIGFGYSRTFELSLGLLTILGAADMVSVVIRHTLVQMQTPNEMRGRVSAVNGMFINVSNELGEFESGFVAWCFARPNDLAYGPTFAVVSGGIGTLLVVGIVAAYCKTLRGYGRADEKPGQGQGGISSAGNST